MHADQFISDGLLNYLGRLVSPKRSLTMATGTERRGPVACVRADLFFDPGARYSPHGDLVKYFSERIKHDAASLSSSLVLSVDIDTSGNWDAAPIWTPTHIYGSDLVDMGDAVDALLGVKNNDDYDRRLLSHFTNKLKLVATERRRRESEPSEICGFCFSLSPQFNNENQCWEIISEDTIGNCAGVPVLDSSGKKLGEVGDTFRLYKSDGGVYGSLVNQNVKLNGKRCKFLPTIRETKREWRLFNQPGHELNGHKLEHLHLQIENFVLQNQ